MKLLFDENLSPRLVMDLAAAFPESAHVQDAGLRATADAFLWKYGASRGFAIVSKDTDFRDRSFVFGHPPKVTWLDVDN